MCIRDSRNAQEASVLKDINVFPVTDLCQVTDHIFGIEKIKVYRCNEISGNKNENRDFSQVIGQETAKRAVTIGAAGNHGILTVSYTHLDVYKRQLQMSLSIMITLTTFMEPEVDEAQPPMNISIISTS